MKTWKGAGAALTASWLFVNGATLSTLPGQLATGTVAGFGVAYLFRRMYPGSFDPARGFFKLPMAIIYVLVFLKELLLANIDMARRVLSPSLPISPAVLEYDLELENDLGITVLANSITLTPGTLTLDYNETDRKLRIHAVDGASRPEEVKEPVRRWEQILEKLFGERKA